MTFRLFLALAISSVSMNAEESQRPNVILMISDDHRHDALGAVQRELGKAANFPFFKTPQLDRLGDSGARFRNAFVVHSLCSPSRATMLTGLYSHQHGIIHNALPFTSTDTWAAVLGASGWKTGYFGKWHMGEQRERPGFEETATFIGQGVYFDCPFLVNGKETPTTGWVDDVTTDFALDFIKRNRRVPFAMMVGFKTPHDKRTPPERYATLHSDARFKEPASGRDDPPWRKPGTGKVWLPESKDRLAYFQTIAGMDENVGRILDVLEDLKLRENTLIIYVGDNGYYLGEHGLGDKRTAYEESIRIPFLLSFPNLVKKGTIRDEMVLNLDIAATILEYCGLRPTWKQYGRSLVPLLASAPGETAWRRTFLYTNYEDPAYPTVPQDSGYVEGTFDVLALRTESQKYIEYPGHPAWSQFFDLRVDPLEMDNLISKPSSAEALKEIKKEFETQKAAVDFKRVLK